MLKTPRYSFKEPLAALDVPIAPRNTWSKLFQLLETL